MSSSTACDSGTSEAPNRPWSSRNSTISGRRHGDAAQDRGHGEARDGDQEQPLAPEARLEEPVTGVAMAAATI